MILIADINAETKLLDIQDTGHTPWAMWGKLADDGTAYVMNYKQIDKQLIRNANLIVLRLEENVKGQEANWPGFLEIVAEAACPKLCIIEGDMNGFRNWKKEFHLTCAELFNEHGVYMVSRDIRILPYYRTLYDNCFFFASLFDIDYLSSFAKSFDKRDDLIFVPYATHIGGDRNSKLSVILAHNLAQEFDCKVITCQSDRHDAMFAFQIGFDRVISLPFLETEEYLSIMAQSKLCVNLDTIPGFGKVGAETACTKVLHLGTGTCGVTHHCWSHISYSYLEYDKLYGLGSEYLQKPENYREDIETAYTKVQELDLSKGRQILKNELRIDKL